MIDRSLIGHWSNDQFYYVHKRRVLRLKSGELCEWVSRVECNPRQGPAWVGTSPWRWPAARWGRTACVGGVVSWSWKSINRYLQCYITRASICPFFMCSLIEKSNRWSKWLFLKAQYMWSWSIDRSIFPIIWSDRSLWWCW